MSAQTFPYLPTFGDVGGIKAAANPDLVDESIDHTADEVNTAFATVVASAQVVPLAVGSFTVAGGAITGIQFRSTVVGASMTVVRATTGTYQLAWHTTVSDVLGNPQSVVPSIVFAQANDPAATVTSTTQMTWFGAGDKYTAQIYVYQFGGGAYDPAQLAFELFA